MVLPKCTTNDALDAMDLLSEAGLELMDWQAVLLWAWMGVDPRGRWAAPVCGNETPRQNGKTRCLQGRCAAEMLFYGGTVIYTAQLQKTSTETFEEMAALMDVQALHKYLAPKGIRTALGREEIRLKNGGRMKFLARTRNGGNGQHGSLLIFDESQYLDHQSQGSFLAAISACRTERGPQTIYNGNSPEDGDYALVFERIREDALSGKTKRTAWTEWSVGDGATVPNVDDRADWERTNPSWGVLIDPDTIEAEHESEDAEQFAHQRLGWFKKRGGGVKAISAETWSEQAADSPDEWRKLAYGVRFTPDGAYASISVAISTDDGRYHTEFIEQRSMVDGIGWLVEWIGARVGKFEAVAIDGKASVDDLCKRLREAGVPRSALMPVRTQDAITACQMLLNDLREGTLTHPEDEALNEAALGATRRRIGNDGGFGFAGENVCRLESCALALWAVKTTKRDTKRKAVIW